MPRMKFRRPSKPLDQPVVSLRQGRFHYNATFARLAELEKKKAVTYYLDHELREISFEFAATSDDNDSYKLENRGGPAKFRSAAQDLIKKNIWIRSVVNTKSGAPSTFMAKRDGKLWAIRLCPAFEYKAKRADVLSIPADAIGIYRYINGAGAVVYIGKGAIRQRAQDQERLEWNFDTIEFSHVADSEQQYEWESFWIDRFTEESNGELPAYNRQAGNKG